MSHLWPPPNPSAPDVSWQLVTRMVFLFALVVFVVLGLVGGIKALVFL